jgi:hypothetical protein
VPVGYAPRVESVATGAESEKDRAKRHRQRTLFDAIAERYEESRPSYPSRVTEFVTTNATLAPEPRSWKSAAAPASSPNAWQTTASA